jgi:hypothetical protein
MGTVGCVPRTHRLIGVIGDHALQDRNRTEGVCISMVYSKRQCSKYKFLEQGSL